MSEPEEITTMSGQKLQLKMSVDYISFSAHTDYQQTSEFIRALKPPHVVRFSSNHLTYTASVTAELSQRLTPSKQQWPFKEKETWKRRTIDLANNRTATN